MQFSEEEILFGSVFMALELSKLQEFIDKKRRLVHYTSAEVAISILKNREVWMRNALTMNDFMEIEYGIDLVRGAIANEETKLAFGRALNSISDGLYEEVSSGFDGWLGMFQSDTYITSLSEHYDSEDENGRLSMWRAYGSRNGVAIVVNPDPFLVASDAFYSSPVNYTSREEFEKYFIGMISRINIHKDELSKFEKGTLVFRIMHAFRNIVLCTKHPGFLEEKEWRVIYCPSLDKSEVVDESVEIVRSVPQLVNKIPLADLPDSGLAKADIKNLINRIIIGPTEDQFVIRKALIRTLEAAEVDAPDKIVQVSGIPLRSY